MDTSVSTKAAIRPGLVEKEIKHIAGHATNLMVVLGVFVIVTIATFAGTSWEEWAANGWTPLHWYMPAIPFLLSILVRHDVRMAQHTHDTRTHYVAKTVATTAFSYYVLTIGILMESGAVAYLVYAHATDAVPLVRVIRLLIGAYTISALSLILMCLMWYYTWRIERYNETVVSTGNHAADL